MALSAVQLSLAKKPESALTGLFHIRSLLIAHFIIFLIFSILIPFILLFVSVQFYNLLIQLHYIPTNSV